MTVVVDKTKCIGCGACVMECPLEALELVDGFAEVDPQKCKDLGNCVGVCPVDALSLANPPTRPQAEPPAAAGPASEAPTPDTETVKDAAAGSGPVAIRAQTASPAAGDAWSGVWVIVEYSHGEAASVSWELLGEGRKLADAIGCGLCAVVAGYQVDHAIPLAFAYGAEKVYVIDHPLLRDYRTEPYMEAIAGLAVKYRPEIILMGATSMGRDVFPAVATRLQTALTADCTVLGVDPETKVLLQTRPAFGGNIMATILCRTRRPQMATVRPRVMAMPERVDGRTGEVVREEFNFTENDFRTRVVEFIPSDAKSAFLDKAEIIVSVGLGIAAKRNLIIAQELADVLGATLAGSRGAVEAGWLPHERLVGQTGTTVRPKVYIAIGISGAIQHLVGMQTSDFIIAINNDPEAPILKVANFGIVGDLFQIVPALTAEFKKRLQSGAEN